MKKTTTILKASFAIAIAASIGFGCNQELPEDGETGTADAIVAGDSSAVNLNNPRPAPIGDTSVTGEQADQFGDMNPNQDQDARDMIKLDEQKQRQSGNQ